MNIYNIFSPSISFPPKSNPISLSQEQQQQKNTPQIHSNSLSSSSVQLPRGFPPQKRWINHNWIQNDNNNLLESNHAVRKTATSPGISDIPEFTNPNTSLPKFYYSHVLSCSTFNNITLLSKLVYITSEYYYLDLHGDSYFAIKYVFFSLNNLGRV